MEKMKLALPVYFLEYGVTSYLTVVKLQTFHTCAFGVSRIGREEFICF